MLKSYPKEESELISTRHSEQEITAVAYEHCDSIEGEHLLMAQGYNDGSIGNYSALSNTRTVLNKRTGVPFSKIE